MAAPRNYDALAMTLAVWTGQYNNPSRERDEKEQEFKNIISEADTKDFTLLLTDGTQTQLRLFISTDQDVCFFAKGSRSRGYRLNLDKVESIEAKQKKEQDKYKTFHRNCEKAAGLLAASGFWPEIQKRMAVMAAMTVEDYNRLMTLWQEYDELYNHRELTYDEMSRLQDEKRKEYEAYFTERGATGDWYHFRQLSENKQIVSVPYSNGGYGKERQVAYAREIIEQVKQGEAGKYKTFYWYGNYDFHIEVRKNDDGTIYGWYSAEYKGCGNGHYYLLLDAEHAIYCEDD